MDEKSLPIVLVDLVAAGVAVAAIFLALRIFQVPNCTAPGVEPVFAWVRHVSVALVAGSIVEFMIGRREDSMLSKAIGASCALALLLLCVIYSWKIHAIAAMAC